MAVLPGWSWYKIISLTGQSGSGTLYQVDLDIGDSAGGDFHLEGHCTNFPQDIIITDDDGTTLLDFWIEDTTADPLKMWVEVADDLGSNQSVRVYYGKSGATTNSNIGNTFLVGDDFEVAGIGDWTTMSGSPDYDSATQARSPTHSMQCSNAAIEGAYISQTASNNIAFDCWVYVDSVTTRAFFFGHGDGTDAILLASIGQDIKYYDIAWRDTGVNIVLDSWKKLSVYDFDWGAGTYKMSYDGNIANCNIRQNNAADPNQITLRMQNAVTYYDDVRVRKYNSPEPAFASAGAEQSTARTTKNTRSTANVHAGVMFQTITGGHGY